MAARITKHVWTLKDLLMNAAAAVKEEAAQ
jgi:hypothetical protein